MVTEIQKCLCHAKKGPSQTIQKTFFSCFRIRMSEKWNSFIPKMFTTNMYVFSKPYWV